MNLTSDYERTGFRKHTYVHIGTTNKLNHLNVDYFYLQNIIIGTVSADGWYILSLLCFCLLLRLTLKYQKLIKTQNQSTENTHTHTNIQEI